MSFIRPPSPPPKAAVVAPISFAALRPRITFSLFPDVEMPIAMSPLEQSASICREKRLSNPKSFPIAVSADVSVVREMAGIARRSFLNLTTNSVAMCWASPALPP